MTAPRSFLPTRHEKRQALRQQMRHKVEPIDPGCPTCGRPLTITTDVLIGITRAVCEWCARQAERAKLEAAQLRAALAIVAKQYRLTVEELVSRLSRVRIPRPRPPRMCLCGKPAVRKGKRCPECAEREKRVYSKRYYEKNKLKWRTTYARAKAQRRAKREGKVA